MCVMSVKIALLAASGHGGVCKRSGQTGRGVTFRIEGLKHLVDRNPVAKKQTVRGREADAGRRKAFASAVCGDFGDEARRFATYLTREGNHCCAVLWRRCVVPSQFQLALDMQEAKRVLTRQWAVGRGAIALPQVFAVCRFVDAGSQSSAGCRIRGEESALVVR